MTRLTTEWIKDMESELPAWREKLEKLCGMNLLNLAALAGDVSRGRVKSASWRLKVAVVPVTGGLGVISTFSETVAAIVRLLGFESFVTESTDVNGFYEASQRGATIIFFANDDRFLAVNLAKNQVVENSDATARGFVAALEGASGGLRDREVLVLGGGPVGTSAIARLKLHGASVNLYDIDSKVRRSFSKESGVKVLNNLDTMKDYPLIVDATPAADWISADMLHPEVIFVSPGVPLSLQAEAEAQVGDRLVHDLLQTGVITMLAMAC